jgi:hypothetical protein
MKAELMRDLYGTNHKLVMAKGEIFKIKVVLNRFGNDCFEIIEGDREGYLLSKSDCKIII